MTTRAVDARASGLPMAALFSMYFYFFMLFTPQTQRGKQSISTNLAKEKSLLKVIKGVNLSMRVINISLYKCLQMRLKKKEITVRRNNTLLYNGAIINLFLHKQQCVIS